MDSRVPDLPGGFFEIYDLIFTGYIAPGMAPSGLLQTTTESFFGFHGIAGFITATFASLFVGTFFLGWLPDRYGRKAVFTYSLLWYCVASAIRAFQNNYGFANWVPTLLMGQGITVTKSLLYSFIIAFALPCGTLLAMCGQGGAKWLIVGAAIAVIAFGLLFGQMRNPGLLIVFGVLISLAGQTISVAYHTYQTELFPTAIRSRANGFVYSASRIGAMLSGFLIAGLLRNYGVPGVFAGISACMLVVVISIGMLGPKTNGLRLEEISH